MVCCRKPAFPCSPADVRIPAVLKSGGGCTWGGTPGVRIVAVSAITEARNVKAGYQKAAALKNLSASAFRLPEKRSDIF